VRTPGRRSSASPASAASSSASYPRAGSEAPSPVPARSPAHDGAPGDAGTCGLGMAKLTPGATGEPPPGYALLTPATLVIPFCVHACAHCDACENRQVQGCSLTADAFSRLGQARHGVSVRAGKKVLRSVLPASGRTAAQRPGDTGVRSAMPVSRRRFGQESFAMGVVNQRGYAWPAGTSSRTIGLELLSTVRGRRPDCASHGSVAGRRRSRAGVGSWNERSPLAGLSCGRTERGASPYCLTALRSD
jgi:hypothetical protein